MFASLVIVAHTPELIDGNRSREILTSLFGTITFGDLAVDGFFIISGFLITGSLVKRPDVRGYLTRRIARIYPAFLLASILCVFVVAPLGDGTIPSSVTALAKAIKAMLTLQPPPSVGAFAGTPYPALNGATWTIAYEFRCYLLVLLLHFAGILSRKWLVPLLALALLLVFCMQSPERWGAITDRYIPGSWLLTGHIGHMLRTTGCFLAGASFFLWKDQIALTKWGVLVASAALVLIMFVPRFCEIGVATFGAYIVFGVAKLGARSIIGEINNKNDISYGLYLYGWPVEKLILYYYSEMGPAIACLLTLVLAAACGWISWHFLEKPVMRRVAAFEKRRLQKRIASPPQASA